MAHIGEELTFSDFKLLTKGRHEKSIGHQPGMPRYAELKSGQRKGVIPATWFHSKEKGGQYEDIIDPADKNKVGYAMYYGDNGWKEERPPHQSADDSWGIKQLNGFQDLYFSDDKSKRSRAPPILISQNFKKGGVSMRRFLGIGVLIGREIISLEDRGLMYDNALYHLALLELPEGLDWDWVDALRDPGMSIQNTLDLAPASWRRWVEGGNATISDGPIEKSLGDSYVRPPSSKDPLTVAEEKGEDDGTGEVYAITNSAWPGYVKIGRAMDAKKRLRDYQTYSPLRDYTLRHRVRCNDRKSSEKRAHKRAGLLALGRRNGEWFKMTLEQAEQVLDHVSDS